MNDAYGNIFAVSADGSRLAAGGSPGTFEV